MNKRKYAGVNEFFTCDDSAFNKPVWFRPSPNREFERTSPPESIGEQSEEPLGTGESVGPGAVGAGNIGERAGERGRGLEAECGVSPAQHERIARPQPLEQRRGRRVFHDGQDIEVNISIERELLSEAGYEDVVICIDCDSIGRGLACDGRIPACD